MVFYGSLTGFGAGSSAEAAVAGQQEWTTPGTYSWTVPTGITICSMVVIGGGGAGSWASREGRGGIGGGLGYRNNVSVTPGETLTIICGGGGGSYNNNIGTSQSTNGNGAGQPGGNSEVKRSSTTLCKAFGGIGGWPWSHNRGNINPGSIPLVGGDYGKGGTAAFSSNTGGGNAGATRTPFGTSSGGSGAGGYTTQGGWGGYGWNGSGGTSNDGGGGGGNIGHYSGSHRYHYPQNNFHRGGHGGGTGIRGTNNESGSDARGLGGAGSFANASVDTEKSGSHGSFGVGTYGSATSTYSANMTTASTTIPVVPDGYGGGGGGTFGYTGVYNTSGTTSQIVHGGDGAVRIMYDAAVSMTRSFPTNANDV